MTEDVLRAVELLEEYHADLFRPTDFELKHSIEKIVNTFKKGLFSALCDIQDFYDNILLNERVSFGQKVVEAQNFARRWDAAGPNLIAHGAKPSAPFPVTTYSRPSSAFGGSVLAPASQAVNTYGQEYDLLDVTIDASRSGLGFSISGGTDRDEEQIRVTNISQGGAVAADGRVRVGDIILKVNDTDCTFVPHARAVQAFNEAGPLVRLVLKRERPQRSFSQAQVVEKAPLPEVRPVHKSRSLHQLPQPQSILSQPRPSSRLSYGTPTQVINTEPRVVFLRKGLTLGMNIVGGEDGEPIYISSVVPGGPADISGQVRRGDVLLRVNNVNLIGATHGTAASALKNSPAHSIVELLLQYRPQESIDFFQKLERQSQLYLNQGQR